MQLFTFGVALPVILYSMEDQNRSFGLVCGPLFAVIMPSDMTLVQLLFHFLSCAIAALFLALLNRATAAFC